jgi:4-alpha-glucanotransferase
MRKSGVLLSISSLPGKYGIGCFSKEAYEFVDYLKKAKQSYWQILPMGPTSYGDSPYQSFSAFAGNPYFIDPDGLKEDGLLTEEECKKYVVKDTKEVDYELIFNTRYELLKKAFERFDLSDEDFKKFVKKEEFWLKDFALFMTLKSEMGGVEYQKWPDDIREHKNKAVKEAYEKGENGIKFTYFMQYYFFKQWASLKAYANSKGIEIVGDIPIYVASDSADVWANPKLFDLDEDYNPKAVAGCPPDCFSIEGQLWGNPLYDWEYHKKTGYKWWIQRMKASYRLYDVVRIDHFRGFESYYTIPYGAVNAVEGEWLKGPGYDLFKAINSELGDVKVIAEDLGFMTKAVKKLVKKCGYPGMKVLEFAFDSGAGNTYLPHNYKKNFVVYTGTHDNETVVGWVQNMDEDTKKYMMSYMNIDNLDEIHWDYIRLAESSVAKIAIIPMQDILGLDNSARMNTPSTIGINWKWRLQSDELKAEDARKLKKICKTYGRK